MELRVIDMSKFIKHVAGCGANTQLFRLEASISGGKEATLNPQGISERLGHLSSLSPGSKVDGV